MKRIILVVFLILFITFIKSNGECDSGWDSESKSYIYSTVPYCEVTIYYCTFTSPLGEFKVKIDRIVVTDYCISGVYDDPDFWDEVRDEVRDDVLNNGTFPPCSTLTAFYFTLKRADCWAVQNVPYDPISQTGGYVQLIDCGEIGYCEWVYKVCADFSKNPSENVWEVYDFNSVASEDCPDSIPILPPLGATWYDEWTTSCYGVTCTE